MIDVHALTPSSGRLTLHKVGVTGVRKPLAVHRDGRVITLSAEFTVTVDLPAERKGSDLSRNAEILAELVDRTATHPVASLESACTSIARELLVRHQYATRSEVEAHAEYFLVRGLTADRQSFEDFLVIAGASATRDPEGALETQHSIGAEAVGMTACPCAMETCRQALLKEYPALRDPSLAELPMITHNQRNRTRLMFDLPEGVEVEVDRIIETIEAAQSSPTYAILKRGGEGQVVLNAHRKPKFVEDVLRDLLSSVPSRFPQLPASTVVRAETVSEESIHKYNVVAAHRATIAEIRPPPPA